MVTKTSKPRKKKDAHLGWIKTYNGGLFSEDFVAALVVTILLVPQALAYAMLAGLPTHIGIYASILPLVAYALVGSSRYLSVGPTAVVSLMSAAAIASVPEGERILSATIIAGLAGVFMYILGVLRAGFIMNFVSRPVVSAYVTGAAILIIFSQLRHVLGISASGTNVFDLASSLFASLDSITKAALYIGLGTIAFLWAVRKYLAFGLYKLGMKRKAARLTARMGPFVAIIVTSLIAYKFDLHDKVGLTIIGDIPSGLPRLSFPKAPLETYKGLAGAAMLIALVGFVDSMSTGQTLAARSRTRIEANREMRALGLANIASGFSGGYTVSGSMSRSVINFTAGAKTPVASLLTAAFMCITALFLTPYLRYLPLATLAALIIFSCFNLIDFRHLWRTFKYSRSDGFTAFLTFGAVLFFGVKFAVLVGVVASMVLHIRSTLRPTPCLWAVFLGRSITATLTVMRWKPAKSSKLSALMRAYILPMRGFSKTVLRLC